MPEVEICIASDDLSTLPLQLAAAIEGGAKRVELCSNMQLDGLTPSVASMQLAQKFLGNEVALLVMIRPKNENFCFNHTEIQNMQESITHAAQNGATGVVIGALDKTQSCFDLEAMQVLVEKAKEHHLSITCHRAFDLLSNPIKGLKQLRGLGVHRVLTAGVNWGIISQAEQHIDQFALYLEQAAGEIEVVIAGKVNAHSANKIKQQLSSTLPGNDQAFSFHAHSGVMTAGQVDQDKVKQLVHAANSRSS